MSLSFVSELRCLGCRELNFLRFDLNEMKATQVLAHTYSVQVLEYAYIIFVCIVSYYFVL
jgi:hypothetical protein